MMRFLSLLAALAMVASAYPQAPNCCDPVTSNCHRSHSRQPAPCAPKAAPACADLACIEKNEVVVAAIAPEPDEQYGAPELATVSCGELAPPMPKAACYADIGLELRLPFPAKLYVVIHSLLI
ncbi:MAG: hypothetical protein KGN84_20595 [Acidobacteriota bacterium]|nr:hypothetical protein [Acidobacteriota bacterium]